MELEELTVYQMAMEIGRKIWSIVNKWKYFEKSSVGQQLVRSADSITANISEGYGRYYFKENKQFAYYSRGSLYETKTWLTKAHQRQLIKDHEFEILINEITILRKKLNSYIKSIGSSPASKSPHRSLTTD